MVVVAACENNSAVAQKDYKMLWVKKLRIKGKDDSEAGTTGLHNDMSEVCYGQLGIWLLYIIFDYILVGQWSFYFLLVELFI